MSEHKAYNIRWDKGDISAYYGFQGVLLVISSLTSHVLTVIWVVTVGGIGILLMCIILRLC